MRLTGDKKSADKKSKLKAVVKNIVTKTTKTTQATKSTTSAKKNVKTVSVSGAKVVKPVAPSKPKAIVKSAPKMTENSVKSKTKAISKALLKSSVEPVSKAAISKATPKINPTKNKEIGKRSSIPQPIAQETKSMNDNVEKEVVQSGMSVVSSAAPITPSVEGEFAIGNAVVYPSHGVGKIIDIEQQEILGLHQEFYVIEFTEDKMILRVPRNRAFKAGLRALCTTETFDHAIAILKEKAKISRGMWSKRAQEYGEKINSGHVVSIAEVLRDLHKNSEDPERSYSERTIYELAFERFVAEFSVAKNLSKDAARTKIIDILDTASILAA